MSWALSVPLLLQRLALAAAVAAHVAGSRQRIVAGTVAPSLPPGVLSSHTSTRGRVLSALLLVLPLLVACTTAKANHAAAGRQRIVARALSHHHCRRGCCRSTYRLGA